MNQPGRIALSSAIYAGIGFAAASIGDAIFFYFSKSSRNEFMPYVSYVIPATTILTAVVGPIADLLLPKEASEVEIERARDSEIERIASEERASSSLMTTDETA